MPKLFKMAPFNLIYLHVKMPYTLLMVKFMSRQALYVTTEEHSLVSFLTNVLFKFVTLKSTTRFLASEGKQDSSSKFYKMKSKCFYQMKCFSNRNLRVWSDWKLSLDNFTFIFPQTLQIISTITDFYKYLKSGKPTQIQYNVNHNSSQTQSV